jgi:hypothetical protein
MAEITTITTAGITIITFTDDRIAEIIIDPAATPEHVLDAVDLARLLLAHGITAAKIIRTTQTAKESPPPRFDQEGGGQSHHKGGRNGKRD